MEDTPLPSERSSQPPEDEGEKEEQPKGAFECAICLDGVTEPVVTMCGHLFWYEFPQD